MQQTAEQTWAYYHCRIAYVWADGRMDGQSGGNDDINQNENFSHLWITKFSKLWGSAHAWSFVIKKNYAC